MTVKRPRGVDPLPQAATITSPSNGQFKESIPQLA